MYETIQLQTHNRCELVDITPAISEVVQKSKVQEGVCIIFVPHTTAAITVNENHDPSVGLDVSNTLQRLAPANLSYDHDEGNSDAHVKASVLGSSRTLFVENGRIAFGSWQGIFFCEFDGPRRREVWIKVIKD